MSNTFDKLSVLDSFIEEVNSYLPEIETNLERLAHSPGDMDAIEETYRRTHTIGGSASMMDFPGLAHVAHGMEDILGDALDGVSTLDVSSLELLQRSLGRMHQLLQGIHEGIDEEAIMAEDDADYVRYRASIDSSSQAVANGSINNVQAPSASLPSSFTDDIPELPELPAPTASSITSLPSFDEVLASFRIPSVTTDEDSAWPEEIAPDEPVPADPTYQAEQVQQTPVSYFEEQTAELAQPETILAPEPEPVSPSAWEILVATTAAHPVPPVESVSSYYNSAESPVEPAPLEHESNSY